MAIIPNPLSELLREPNLLVPGKKPVGLVKCEPGGPDNFWLFRSPGGWDVSGNQHFSEEYTVYGTPSYEGGNLVLDTARTTLALPASYNLGTVHTLIIDLESSLDSDLVFGGSTNYYGMFWSGADLLYRAGAPYVFFSYNLPTTRTHLAIARDGTTLDLYVNGVYHSTKTLGSNPDFAFKQITGYVTGEYGMVGTIYNAKVYLKYLNASELAREYSDPYKDLIPA